MDAADAGRTHNSLRDDSLRHILAGLEAGVTGALLMIVWAMVASLAARRSVWTIPNLYATSFYGPAAYQNEFLRSSWSGLAVMVALCGVGGVLWGLVVMDRKRPLLALAGAAVGLGVYYLVFDVLFRHTNPLIPLYAPDRQMQVGFVLWGMTLARAPLYSRRLAGQ
jgi:hypothetical protein